MFINMSKESKYWFCPRPFGTTEHGHALTASSDCSKRKEFFLSPQGCQLLLLLISPFIIHLAFHSLPASSDVSDVLEYLELSPASFCLCHLCLGYLLPPKVHTDLPTYQHVHMLHALLSPYSFPPSPFIIIKHTTYLHASFPPQKCKVSEHRSLPTYSLAIFTEHRTVPIIH